MISRFPNVDERVHVTFDEPRAAGHHSCVEAVDAIRAFLARLPEDSYDVQDFLRIVTSLEERGCVGLTEKIGEYGSNVAKRKRLRAELRMGLALSIHCQRPVEFRTQHEPDLRIDADTFQLAVEVEHKSAVDAAVAVFLPDKITLEQYATATERWKRASHALHAKIATLPISVEAVLDGRLHEPQWEGRDRTKLENECGDIAEWLMRELQSTPVLDTLVHPSKKARFAVTANDSAPGRISGLRCGTAYIIREYPSSADRRQTLSESLCNAVMRKAQQFTSGHPWYIVGLVIDQSVASTGHVLANTLLGSLTYDSYEKRVYRMVPSAATAKQRLGAARLRPDRQELLSLAQYDDEKPNQKPGGLFFDSRCDHIAGVLALYYTSDLQFVPNPFSMASLERLHHLFPLSLKPFRLQGWA